MLSNRIMRAVVLAAIVGGLSGCGAIKEKIGKKDVAYRSAGSLDTLEVPPDLTAVPPDQNMAIPGHQASYSDFVEGRQTVASVGSVVLPAQKNIRLVRAGSQRWLVLTGQPAQVWPKVREFLVQKGLAIARENAQTGVVETDWAEKKPNVKTGGISGILSKYIGSSYETGIRDKFRIRIEEGRQAGTTELYLTHKGMVERVSDIQGDASVTTMWEPRPTDPELEAEMLRELMIFLGVDEPRAARVVASAAQGPASAAVQADKARAILLTEGGRSLITLFDRFDVAWRRVGLALDRAGFTVEDRDRSVGTYYVRYGDAEKKKKKGFLKRLLSRKKKKRALAVTFQVRITENETGTEVTALDASGASDSAGKGDQILQLLLEQLR